MFSRGTKVSVHRSVKSTSVLPCGRAVVKKKAEAQKLLQVLEVLRGSAAFEVAFLKSSGSAAFEVALLKSSGPELRLFPFSQNPAHFAWPSCSGKGWLSAL
jgi:hypothetical protein